MVKSTLKYKVASKIYTVESCSAPYVSKPALVYFLYKGINVVTKAID